MTPEEIRKLAVDLFNHVWTLLEKAERTRAEDDEMLHAAHASRYHWGAVGEPVNFSREEWQCSRVYSILGRAEPALFHAQRSLDLCLEHGIGDFDLAFAYEALARAHRVAGNDADVRRNLEAARHAAEAIADPDDRDHFDEDVAELER